MEGRNMSSVAEFRDNVLDVAGRVLRAHHPAFVAAVDGVVASGTSDAEQLLAAIRDMPTPEFRRWKRILEQLLEVDLAAFSLVTSLKLLKIKFEPGTLERMGLTAGEWVAYQFDAWLVLMDAFIERGQ